MCNTATGLLGYWTISQSMHNLFRFCIADYVDKLLDLIFELFQDPAPYVDEELKIPISEDLCPVWKTREAGSDSQLCVEIQSRTGLNPTYLPWASENSVRIYSTRQAGSTTWILRPRKPKHQLYSVSIFFLF